MDSQPVWLVLLLSVCWSRVSVSLGLSFCACCVVVGVCSYYIHVSVYSDLWDALVFRSIGSLVGSRPRTSDPQSDGTLTSDMPTLNSSTKPMGMSGIDVCVVCTNVGPCFGTFPRFEAVPRA